MNPKDYCFCTLALGKKYRLLARQLAEDLEKYSPNTPFIILTDGHIEFEGLRHVLIFQHKQQGIKYCYHDRRFVLLKALDMFSVAINIDADRRIYSKVPDDIKWSPGITGEHENLLDYNKRRPEMLSTAMNLSKKLQINVNNAQWVRESLFVITRDSGREIDFLNQWGIFGRYMELKGIYKRNGNSIGLAAA